MRARGRHRVRGPALPPRHRILPVLALACAGIACVAVSWEDPRRAGGGEGRVTLDPDRIPAAKFTQLSLTLHVGEGGLAQGGGFRVRLPVDPVHPFLGFTPPQTHRRVAPGFVACDVERAESSDGPIAGPSIAPAAVAYLGVEGEAACGLTTGRLAPGDRVVMRYRGLVPRVSGGWRLPVASRYSGGRGGRPIPVTPVLTVTARPARALQAVLPSQARIARPVSLFLTVLDEFGNLDENYRGSVRVVFEAGEILHSFTAADAGAARVTVVPQRTGYLRAEVEEVGQGIAAPLIARSNPMRVVSSGDPFDGGMILWGDLHAHTGGGAPGEGFLPGSLRAGDRRGNVTSQEEAFAFARDVMRLDFAAMTEYASRALTAEAWDHAGRVASRYDGSIVPFTALRGFEWNRRLVLPAVDAALPPVEGERTPGAPSALGGESALHFLLGGAPDDAAADGWECYSWLNRGGGYEDAKARFEPSSEWVESLGGRSRPMAVVAGSANHWGRPGTRDRTGLEPGAGGLTGLRARGHGAGDIMDALASGRSWGTTGPRILLLVDPDPEGKRVRFEAAGEDILHSLELIVIDRFDSREHPILHAPAWDVTGTIDLPEMESDSFWFIRAVQRDGARAWSSLHPARAGDGGAGD